ncbi:hypothetical protein SUGI_0686590 [Cryptomeria japonica]|uniref:phospholipase A1-Igamma3, chloroplastic-like n=1 Tax=Cryptomeria japonica TaxID=3369 RepID=UPI0024146983|nr:phospholipase A1-Igamma3, chloroplastic-like [Cryptomeria japonica]GLJ34154.1 hypothetical protein SUGI_0686590 [Cryptomeria japonica]
MEGRGEEQQKPSVGGRWEDIEGKHSWEGLLDPFDSTLKSEILRYGDFARVCYHAVVNERSRKGNLLLQESDNLQNCGYEITESIFVSVPSVMSYITRGPRMRTVWCGFIAVCTNENEIRRLGRRDIVVVFRGTGTPREWVQNLKLKVVAWSHLPDANPNPDVRVCMGFLGFYTDKEESLSKYSARDIIQSEITRLLEKYKGESLSITFTGHSLGAALATLSAYDIKLMQPSIPVTVFAFASPRVGNQAFASHMERIGVNVLRVVLKGDLIPLFPSGFFNRNREEHCHVGTVIFLDPDSSGELQLWKIDAMGRHDLGNHLYLIDGYQGGNREFISSDRGKRYIAKKIRKS